MLRIRIIAIVMVIGFLAVPAVVFGAEKFGMIFDIQGAATLTSKDGKAVDLVRAKHILKPVFDGDTVSTGAGGKVLIVAMADKSGYEVSSDSAVKISDGKVAKVKGSYNMKQGLEAPALSGAKGPIGAIVLRGTGSESCAAIVSPSNTAITTLMPTLTWTSRCEGSVTIRVLHRREVIFEVAGPTANAIKLPEGLLTAGETYRWLVDANKQGIVGTTFNVIDSARKSQIEAMAASLNKDDVAARLSYIFALVNSNLSDQARAEIASLKADFPENVDIMTVFP